MCSKATPPFYFHVRSIKARLLFFVFLFFKGLHRTCLWLTYHDVIFLFVINRLFWRSNNRLKVFCLVFLSVNIFLFSFVQDGKRTKQDICLSPWPSGNSDYHFSITNWLINSLVDGGNDCQAEWCWTFAHVILLCFHFVPNTGKKLKFFKWTLLPLPLKYIFSKASPNSHFPADTPDRRKPSLTTHYVGAQSHQPDWRWYSTRVDIKT